MKNQLFVILFIVFVLNSIKFLDAKELTGHEIMILVDERDDGETRQSEIKMTLINKRGKQRIREVKNLSKDYGKDSKSIMIFNKPADVKGTGFLSWEYEDQTKDDARWLYMPALKKVRRISGSSDNDYFMGTDFTYDDMGDRSVEEDNHKLISEETVDGHDCWVIESNPKSNDELFVKRLIRVRKDIFMVIKVEYFDKMGLMKTLYIKEIEEIDGVWTAQKMIMDNVQKKHKTEITISNIVYNSKINDSIFKVSTIERGRL